MKTVKTSTMTINIVNNKIISARNLKTGRFVKLSIAKLELEYWNNKHIDNVKSFSGITAVISCMLLFVFIMLAFMFKKHGYMAFEIIGIFVFFVCVSCAILSVGTALYTVIKDMMLNNQYKTM